MLSESTAQRLERVLPRGQADRLGEDGVRQAVAAAGDEGDGGADVPRGLRRPQVGGDAGLHVAAARGAHCAGRRRRSQAGGIWEGWMGADPPPPRRLRVWEPHLRLCCSIKIAPEGHFDRKSAPREGVASTFNLSGLG